MTGVTVQKVPACDRTPSNLIYTLLAAQVTEQQKRREAVSRCPSGNAWYPRITPRQEHRRP